MFGIKVNDFYKKAITKNIITFYKKFKIRVIKKKIGQLIQNNFFENNFYNEINEENDICEFIEKKNNLLKILFTDKETLFFNVLLNKLFSMNHELKKYKNNNINNIDKIEILYNNLSLFDLTEQKNYLSLMNEILKKELCFNISLNEYGIKINSIPYLWKYSLGFRYFLSDFIVKNINYRQIKELILSDLSGVIMNGKHFKYFFPDQMYKFINRNMINRDFEFQIGSNIDTNTFDPTSKHSKGGFHFTTQNHIHEYSYCGDFTWKIYIPDNAILVIKDTEVKTDRLIILDRELLFYFD